MKAIIEIELGNSAFGNNDAERLFEMRNVIERLMDNADRIMVADVGDFTTAQDGNGLKNQAPDQNMIMGLPPLPKV
jgi:hypothetical protein